MFTTPLDDSFEISALVYNIEVGPGGFSAADPVMRDDANVSVADKFLT